MGISDTPLQQLLTKDVSRKEFLAIVGLGILSIFGLSSIIKFLTGHNISLENHAKVKGGYGSSAYGE
jgi:hypothetical protein